MKKIFVNPIDFYQGTITTLKELCTKHINFAKKQNNLRLYLESSVQLKSIEQLADMIKRKVNGCYCYRDDPHFLQIEDSDSIEDLMEMLISFSPNYGMG